MILRACEELNQCGHASQRVLTGCRRMPWRHQARIDRPTGARLWHPGVRCPPGSAQHVSRGAADERTLAYRAQNRQHPGPAHHDGRWCSALSPRAATARGRPGLWATLRDLSKDPARSIPTGSEHPGGANSPPRAHVVRTLRSVQRLALSWVPALSFGCQAYRPPKSRSPLANPPFPIIGMRCTRQTGT